MNSRILKLGGLAGILYPVLQMTAQGLIQVGGTEPAFTAGAAEILAFFENRRPDLFAIGEYLSVVSMILFIWFTATLWARLRDLEGAPGMLSMVALGSGVAAVSALFGGGWSLAMFRLPDGLDPQMARMLFDEGNLGFANHWIAIGSMVLAAGLVFRTSAEAYPRWWGPGSLVVAVGLIFARFVWTSAIAFLPYVLFWVWMIVLGVGFIRRKA